MKFKPKAFPTETTPGMNLRDYFAAAAMQGYIANSAVDFSNKWDLVRQAYEIADTMIEIRDEKE